MSSEPLTHKPTHPLLAPDSAHLITHSQSLDSAHPVNHMPTPSSAPPTSLLYLQLLDSTHPVTHSQHHDSAHLGTSAHSVRSTHHPYISSPTINLIFNTYNPSTLNDGPRGSSCPPSVLQSLAKFPSFPDLREGSTDFLHHYHHLSSLSLSPPKGRLLCHSFHTDCRVLVSIPG